MAATEKQQELVKKLSQEQGSKIPEGVFDDFDATSELITDLLSKAKSTPKPPSSKQMSFAQKLSKEKGLELPKDINDDWRVCSDFISTALSS